MNVNPVNTILRDRGKTQESLAEDLLVTPQHLNRVINGKYSSPMLHHRIAKILDKPQNELFPTKGEVQRRAKALP